MVSMRFTTRPNNTTLSPHSEQCTLTPCNPKSYFHDLKCGHRIRAPILEPCGSNCEKSPPSPKVCCPFICLACITRCVYAELQNTLSDPDMTWENRDRMENAIAQQEIDKVIHYSSRLCDPVEKVAPALPSCGDMDAGGRVVSGDPVRQSTQAGEFFPDSNIRGRSRSPDQENYRRRGRSPDRETGGRASYRQRDDIRGRHAQGINASLDELMGHLQDTRVGLLAEDDAMKVVREDLGGLTLETSPTASKAENEGQGNTCDKQSVAPKKEDYMDKTA